jgi:hypothetical protein
LLHFIYSSGNFKLQITSETKQQTENSQPLQAVQRDAAKVIKRKQPLDEPSIAVPRPQKLEGKTAAPTPPKPQEQPEVPRVEVVKPQAMEKVAAPKPQPRRPSPEPPKQAPEPPKAAQAEAKKQPVPPKQNEARKIMQVPSVEITESTPVIPHQSNKFSSTEQLITKSDPPSPVNTSLGVGQKVEGVSTIKRQPKTGWL